jgi:hypothetical protein
MAEHRCEIGVIVARKALTSRWADHAWVPHAVLPAAPEVAPGTPLGAAGPDMLFYAGPAELVFHHGSTAHYRDNLASGRPSLWVSLRLVDDGCEVARATADPYEGEALTEGIGSVVEAAPMPPELQARLAAFVAAVHVERPFFKRQRDRYDPDAIRHRPTAARPGGA